MNRFGVIYFTRTNNSKRIAEKISNKLSSDLIPVTDNINWKGIFGYLKAGSYSMRNQHVDIEVLGDLDDVEEYIVVGPLWAGGLAPAVKNLLNQLPRNKVHLVVSSKKDTVEDRSGFLSVHDITRKADNEDMVIEGFVNSLMKP
jgi:hypothetical protein